MDHKLKDEFSYTADRISHDVGGYSNYRQPVTLLGLDDSVSELFGGQQRTPSLPNGGMNKVLDSMHIAL
jgi:hypothetical protein